MDPALVQKLSILQNQETKQAGGYRGTGHTHSRRYSLPVVRFRRGFDLREVAISEHESLFDVPAEFRRETTYI